VWPWRLIEPYKICIMKKILIAINGDDSSTELVNLGLLLGKQERAELYVVYVFEVPLSLTLDSENPGELEKGDKILEKAVELAEEKRLEIVTDIIQARSAGAGIVSQAFNLNADMVIIGMKEFHLFGDIPHSPTVEYVLMKAPCRVIVVRREIKNSNE